MANLPPIEEYEGFSGAAVLAQYIPSKEEMFNIVKAGGGVVGAFLAADRLIPMIPVAFIQDNVYARAGVKVVGAILAAKFVPRLDPFLGAGMAAGLAGSAIYDLADHLIFGGTLPGAMSAKVAAAAPETVPAGLGQSSDEMLFLGEGEERLFNDVDIMRPSSLGDVEIMRSNSPLYGQHGPYTPDTAGVGSFLT